MPTALLSRLPVRVGWLWLHYRTVLTVRASDLWIMRDTLGASQLRAIRRVRRYMYSSMSSSPSLQSPYLPFFPLSSSSELGGTGHASRRLPILCPNDRGAQRAPFLYLSLPLAVLSSTSPRIVSAKSASKDSKGTVRNSVIGVRVSRRVFVSIEAWQPFSVVGITPHGRRKRYCHCPSSPRVGQTLGYGGTSIYYLW